MDEISMITLLAKLEYWTNVLNNGDKDSLALREDLVVLGDVLAQLYNDVKHLSAENSSKTSRLESLNHFFGVH